MRHDLRASVRVFLGRSRRRRLSVVFGVGICVCLLVLWYIGRNGTILINKYGVTRHDTQVIIGEHSTSWEIELRGGWVGMNIRTSAKPWLERGTFIPISTWFNGAGVVLGQFGSCYYGRISLLHAIAYVAIVGVALVVWPIKRSELPFCVSCGYILACNTNDKCPECGASIASRMAYRIDKVHRSMRHRGFSASE